MEEYNFTITEQDGGGRKPPRKKKRWLGAIALMLCCVIIGGSAGYGAFRLFSEKDETDGVTAYDEIGAADTEESAGDAADAGDAGDAADAADKDSTPKESKSASTITYSGRTELSAADLYEQNVNSTVGITTSITTNYFGYQTTSAASGSGFIISEDGYILTNYHVIEDSESITVSLYSGESYDAQLKGYDESNDIAVLKIDASGLKPVTIGDSDDLRVGDYVVAIGNPLGELTFSLTHGMISALDREVTLSSSVTMNLIQTDCAINSGNSGGALFNMYGEVIGITNAKYSSSGSSSEASVDNIGFAIPIDDIIGIVRSIIDNGYIIKPYIGVTLTTASGDVAGALVNSVTDGAPAAVAGLREGDIITAVDGKSVTSSGDIVTIVGRASPGDNLAMSVYRDGATITITVTVGEQQKSALANEEETQEQQSQQNQQNQQGQQDQQGGNQFSFGYGFSPWGGFGNWY